jgi:hypothetical protein
VSRCVYTSQSSGSNFQHPLDVTDSDEYAQYTDYNSDLSDTHCVYPVLV